MTLPPMPKPTDGSENVMQVRLIASQYADALKARIRALAEKLDDLVEIHRSCDGVRGNEEEIRESRALLEQLREEKIL